MRGSTFSWGSEAAARRWIKGAVRRIARKTNPEKIILFGSRAYGQPRPESDFDLLVVMRRPMDPEKYYRLVDRAIGRHLWPIDILVRRPDEIAQRLALGDPFIRDVLQKGRVLYAS